MNKQNVVAVVMGGPSSEAEISRVTGGAIAAALREKDIMCMSWNWRLPPLSTS